MFAILLSLLAGACLIMFLLMLSLFRTVQTGTNALIFRIVPTAAYMLLRLGYAPRNLTQYHCVSACDEHHTDGLVDASDPSLRKAVARFRYLDYYDAETAACVEQLYHRDFEQFGFAPFAQRDGASSSPVVRCCGPHPCAPAHKRPP